MKDILKFYIGQNLFGIAISEVNEIINYHKITPVPNTHPSVEGIFMPRKQIITAIDTLNFLQLGKMESRGMFLLATIQGHEVAFHIDRVNGIERVDEGSILKSNNIVAGNMKSEAIEGAVTLEDNNIMLLLSIDTIVGGLVRE